MSYASELRDIIQKHLKDITGKDPSVGAKIIDGIIEKTTSILKFELAYELYDKHLLRAVDKALKQTTVREPGESNSMMAPYYTSARTAMPLGQMRRDDLKIASVQYRARAHDASVKAVVLDQLSLRVGEKTVEQTVDNDELHALIEECSKNKRLLGKPHAESP